MEFGDEIKADNGGVKLPWLKDDEMVMCNWGGHSSGGPYEVRHITGWMEDFCIRIPADHPYYLATAKGFRYWPGGDDAPGDWDGGEVLWADGTKTRDDRDFQHRGDGYDIIGYRPRTEPVASEPVAYRAGDYVVAGCNDIDVIGGMVYRMIDDFKFADGNGDARPACIFDVRPATLEEISAHLSAERAEGWHKGVTLAVMTRDEADAMQYHIPTLERLGLIAAPTLLEQFEDHHGGLDDNQRAILEDYQKWVGEL